MMAPMHHPATRHVMPARQELGTRTIFNILGPLTNPAVVRRQLTGAFTRAVIRPMAETLHELGSDRAWVVHGADGTDEVSIAGETFVAELNDGQVREFSVHPEDAGLARPSARRDPRRHAPPRTAAALRAAPRRRAVRLPRRGAAQRRRRAAHRRAGRRASPKASRRAAESLNSGAARARRRHPRRHHRRRGGRVSRPMSILDDIRAYKLADVAGARPRARSPTSRPPPATPTGRGTSSARSARPRPAATA